MNIIRYDPWSLFDELFERRYPTSSSEKSQQLKNQWLPEADIKEEDDRYLIHVDVPGVPSEDIDITIDQDTLWIQGKRESEKKEEKKGYVKIERFSGSFSRRFVLPDMDAESVKAKTNKGVLEIEIMKRKAKVSKKIKVEAKD